MFKKLVYLGIHLENVHSVIPVDDYACIGLSYFHRRCLLWQKEIRALHKTQIIIQSEEEGKEREIETVLVSRPIVAMSCRRYFFKKNQDQRRLVSRVAFHSIANDL